MFRPIFNAPLCDELALAQDARQLIGQIPSLPTRDELIDLSEKYSIDLATRTMYESLLVSEHGKFFESLNQLPLPGPEEKRPFNSSPRVQIYIVPGMFYQEHPEVGADGSLVKQIALKYGLEAHIVPVKSTGDIVANSEILARQLEKEASQSIWLISLSKGSAEVRYLLQQETVLNRKICGWVSIAGMPCGSPLADLKLRNSACSIYYRLLCRILGVNFAAIEQLQSIHPFWSNYNWPALIDIIHVVPMPLAAHIQGPLRKRYRQLQIYGPNDGMVPIADILGLPGRFYPVWGCDHFLRAPQISFLLYRLFHYISSQSSLESKGETE